MEGFGFCNQSGQLVRVFFLVNWDLLQQLGTAFLLRSGLYRLMTEWRNFWGNIMDSPLQSILSLSISACPGLQTAVFILSHLLPSAEKRAITSKLMNPWTESSLETTVWQLVPVEKHLQLLRDISISIRCVTVMIGSVTVIRWQIHKNKCKRHLL